MLSWMQHLENCGGAEIRGHQPIFIFVNDENSIQLCSSNAKHVAFLKVAYNVCDDEYMFPPIRHW